MAQWYWMKGEQRRGPVDTGELRRLASVGELKPTDVIWREGLPNWVPASQAKGLFEPPSPTSIRTSNRPISEPPPLPQGRRGAGSPFDASGVKEGLHCPRCMALLKSNPFIISRMKVRCPFCGTCVNPTISGGFLRRVATIASLAFRRSRQPEYRLFTRGFAIFIAVFGVLMILSLFAAIPDFTGKYYPDDPVGPGIGLAVVILLPIALSLYASAVAVKMGHNRWAWFFGNMYASWIPLLILICCGGYLRPLEPTEVFPDAHNERSPRVEFRATNRRVMCVYYPISLVLTLGQAFIWFWPPLLYSGCPIIEYRGLRLRCRWNRRYWLPCTDVEGGIKVYLPLLSFGGKHFWKACKGFAQVLPGARRVTYRAPGIWWIPPGVAVE